MTAVHNGSPEDSTTTKALKGAIMFVMSAQLNRVGGVHPLPQAMMQPPLVSSLTPPSDPPPFLKILELKMIVGEF